jgi:hypothetical protein
VFTKDYLKSNRDTVKKVLSAYMKQLNFELSLSDEERNKKPVLNLKGEEYSTNYQGMNLPQFKKIPLVDRELLYSMQDLLLKHHQISQQHDLENYIESDIINELAIQMYGSNYIQNNKAINIQDKEAEELDRE